MHVRLNSVPCRVESTMPPRGREVPRPSALIIDDRTVPGGDARGDFDDPTTSRFGNPTAFHHSARPVLRRHDTPLDFATDIDGIEIELTERLTTVSGGVSDDRGGVALDTTVIVFADEPEKWGPHSRFIESARPDQQGRFTIRNLPPGRYVAIAVGYLDPGEERDPDVLERWRPRGTLFTFAEGETHGLDLRLSAF